jgi:hypothetical protein
MTLRVLPLVLLALVSLMPLGCGSSNRASADGAAGNGDGAMTSGDATVPLRTLTLADVQRVQSIPSLAVPVKDAAMAGTYYATAESYVEACRCRVGSCSTFHAEPGTVTTAEQHDGMLTMNGYCVGGVEGEGNLWCGGQTSANGVTKLLINDGFFWGSGLLWVGFNLSEEMTVTGSIDGKPVDCDVRTFWRSEARR